MKEPFVFYTDASLIATGAFRAHVQNGKERAIYYASKAFSKTQTRYSAAKREFLTIVLLTRHFRRYFLGRMFTIVTDHPALQWRHNLRDLDELTARWLEKLAPFDYEVRYKPVKSIGHADGLSRISQAKVQIIHYDPEVAGLSEVKSTVKDEWPNAKPTIDPNMLPTEVLTTLHQVLQRRKRLRWLIRTLKLEPSSTIEKLAISSTPTILSLTVSPRTSRWALESPVPFDASIQQTRRSLALCIESHFGYNFWSHVNDTSTIP